MFVRMYMKVPSSYTTDFDKSDINRFFLIAPMLQAMMHIKINMVVVIKKIIIINESIFHNWSCGFQFVEV